MEWNLRTFFPLRGFRGQDSEGHRAGRSPDRVGLEIRSIVNLKSAKTLGIELPTSLLIRANEMIE
jgi:hypothetical protein